MERQDILAKEMPISQYAYYKRRANFGISVVQAASHRLLTTEFGIRSIRIMVERVAQMQIFL
jgi:hypothetical protein